VIYGKFSVISTKGRLNRQERFEQPDAGPKGEGQEPVVNLPKFRRSLTFVRDDSIKIILCVLRASAVINYLRGGDSIQILRCSSGVNAQFIE